MLRSVCVTLLLALPASTLHAQNSATSPDQAVGTSRTLWQQLSGFVTEAAQDMPENKYGYRPTKDVRTFGELIAHVAGSQYSFCATALGDSARAEDDIEKQKKTSKAELVAAMKASNDYCARAYQQTDEASAGKVKMFGQDRTRLYALMINATHDAEHYGNIITYLRLNGMVPPSSKRQ
ncbi:MAG: DinB family protein [Gemmatimonadota bacterium]